MQPGRNTVRGTIEIKKIRMSHDTVQARDVNVSESDIQERSACWKRGRAEELLEVCSLDLSFR